MNKGSNVITMTYTADGEKLTKAITGGATKNYVSGIEYSGSNLEAIYFSEGRCTPNGATAFFYEYTIKDHLGNARASFRAITNGTAIQPLQENHYHPFGMEMEGSWMTQVGTENQYEYNGKELNEDFGLNLYDYGARWYDAALGRWWSVDPLGEMTSSISTYAYVLNNPLSLIDPTGMFAVGTMNEAYEMQQEQSAQERAAQANIRNLEAAVAGFIAGGEGVKTEGTQEETVSDEDVEDPYKAAADKLNKRDPKLNASLATGFDASVEPEGKSVWNPLPGIYDADDLDLNKFVQAVKTHPLYYNDIGTIKVWIDPNQYEGSEIVPIENIPKLLRNGMKSYSRPINAGILDVYGRINRAFEANGIKLGDGTKGTIRTEIWIMPYESKGKNAVHTNTVVWKEPRA